MSTSSSPDHLTPSYLDQNYQNEVKAISLVFVIIAGICLCLRLWTKKIYVKHINSSDAVVCLAWILSASLTATFWITTKWGMGKHMEAVPVQNYEMVLLLLWLSILQYNLTLAFAKLSILLQYVQIFASTPIYRASQVVLVLVCLHAIVATILAITICKPVNYFWDRTKSGTCLDFSAMLFFNAAFNILTDIAVVLLPMWVVRSLHISRAQKFCLGFIFFLGSFGCITSILRLHSVYISSISLDTTWVDADTAVWSSAETNVGITCACLAALRPLIARHFPNNIFGSSRSDSLPTRELKDLEVAGGTDFSTGNPWKIETQITVQDRLPSSSTELLDDEEEKKLVLTSTISDVNGIDMYHSFVKAMA